MEWPEREANPPLSLSELRGLGAPGQGQVERCGHPLQVKTPKAVQDSLAVQRYEGHMSRSETRQWARWSPRGVKELGRGTGEEGEGEEEAV